MSPVFSSTMLAVETSPTLHPARVNGTHGAGVAAATPVAVLVTAFAGTWAE